MKKTLLLYIPALAIFLLPILLFHKELLSGLQGKNLSRLHFQKQEEKKNIIEKPQAPDPAAEVKKNNLPSKEELSLSPSLSGVEMRRSLLVRAIEKTLPALVNIGTERLTSRRYFSSGADPLQQLFDDFLRTQENTKSFSLGSGFLIHPSGLIVTNAHVIDRASRIHVTLSDGTAGEGKIIARDMKSDVALLQLVRKDTNRALPYSNFDLSGILYPGETVIAAGNPFGLASSISAGILSGTKRHFSYGGRILFSDILQTDAIVYPGNSGGPLININGEVIGMNMSSYQNAPGIGFAIPAERIIKHLASWMIPERLHHLSLGLIPGIKKDSNGKYILYAAEIIPGTPAASSGLQAGEQILSVNQKSTLFDPLLLNRNFVTLSKGESLHIGTFNGKIYKLTPRAFMPEDTLARSRKRLKLVLAAITEPMAKELLLPVKNGLLVSGLLPETPGRIKRGDLLVMLDNKRISSPEDLLPILDKKMPGERIKGVFLSPVPERRKEGEKYSPLLQYNQILQIY